ncbi:MAG: histidine kinase [Ferruginibacter sp.]
MIWPFHHKTIARYWLKVFALYALMEACIQLLFLIILNNFGARIISNLEIHFLMWIFQCLLIWPIWFVAWSVSKQKVIVQVLVNIGFYFMYSYAWFGPVQDVIGYLHDNLQEMVRPENDRIKAILDSGDQYSYLNYQLLKHAFRLSWFYLAAYFYNYRLEEKKRTELAVANKELQLKMLKWHLNPSFYFKTINHLRQLAATRPLHATAPILQLAKVMEYVIYEAKEKLIDVKKEIHFLNNYIDLLNSQDSKAAFETVITGDYDKLKISPLLLVGFIDKLDTNDHTTTKRSYRIGLHFSGNELTLTMDKSSGSGNMQLLGQDDDLQRRLTELYPGKFSFGNTNDNKSFKLIITLHEE